jgi:hypothetical protein
MRIQPLESTGTKVPPLLTHIGSPSPSAIRHSTVLSAAFPKPPVTLYPLDTVSVPAICDGQ